MTALSEFSNLFIPMETSLFLSGGAYCIDCGWVRCGTLVTGTAGVVWEMEGAALSKDTLSLNPHPFVFQKK